MVLNMRLSSIAALFAAAVSLSACESGIPFMEKPIVLGCPDYFVLQEAATLTRFQDGPGRDLTDVEVRAQIGEVRLGCESDIENETDSGTLIVDVSPVIAAEMGPANKTDSATLPYFVVVTDPEKKILYREPLDLDVSFKGNRTQLVVIAPPTFIELPITTEIRNDYYRIYAGFELTKEQVQYNRKAIQDRLQ